jgi:hypothetical protein
VTATAQTTRRLTSAVHKSGLHLDGHHPRHPLGSGLFQQKSYKAREIFKKRKECGAYSHQIVLSLQSTKDADTTMDDFVLDARMEHIRAFTAILSAVKLSRKQHVHVTVSERGLTFVAVDDSKSLQAQVGLARALPGGVRLQLVTWTRPSA